MFSSLSESGFIPTIKGQRGTFYTSLTGSHLFQRVASFLLTRLDQPMADGPSSSHLFQRVASFLQVKPRWRFAHRRVAGSHLFQRVASFLPRRCIVCSPDNRWKFSSLSESGFIPTPPVGFIIFTMVIVTVLISFREWLHSYRSMINKAASKVAEVFSSLSESGFIPTGALLSCRQATE